MLTITLLLGAFCSCQATRTTTNCHPTINKSQKNYIIGYGSLMSNTSRSKTNPNVKKLIPVKVDGYARAWNTGSEDYTIIYVGAKSCGQNQKHCFLNGLAYLAADVDATDLRESMYCREQVTAQSIRPYKANDKIDPKANYWIYVTKPEDTYHPDQSHPLIQSYVDLFIGGCIEQAADIAHKTVNNLIYPDDYVFVNDCINKTQGWTTDFWLNDRVYPDRPWGMSPYALVVDKILELSYQNGHIQGEYDYLHIPLE